MEHKAVLKAREDRRLLRGHLWAYRNEFAELPPAEDGAVVDVVTEHGRLVGRGFYQHDGGIAVRLLTRKPEEIGAAFLEHRVRRALAFRRSLYPDSNVFRWIYGESDGLPGLIADRYGPVVIAQSSCAFYNRFADELAAAFMGLDGVEGLIVNQRTWGNVPPAVDCDMDGLKLRVKTDQQQKTGLFLDQRENRKLVLPFSPGATVLDGHCHHGLWSCIVARGGAAQVHGVDTSAPALAHARENAELNGVADRCTFEERDIMDVLNRNDRYDVVILDPPALAKTRAAHTKALGLYRALNRAGMNAVKPGGILITSSCSHFVSRDDFLETLKRASAAAQRPCWYLSVSGAAPDHPVLMGMHETEYLKCAVVRVF